MIFGSVVIKVVFADVRRTDSKMSGLRMGGEGSWSPQGFLCPKVNSNAPKPDIAPNREYVGPKHK